MDTDRGLQEVVSRNVRVMMAVNGITHQKDLAASLNWGADKLTRTLNGNRRWALEDLVDLSRVFGVTPAALLSDTVDLVGASGPAQAMGGVSRGVSRRYHGTNSASILTFPQARADRWRYLTDHAHPNTQGVQNGPGHFGPVTVLSDRPVTSVTAAVGS